MSMLSEHNLIFTDVNSEIEENEEEIFNNSGISTQKLWFPNTDKTEDWIGVDILSKADIWRLNYFTIQGINPENTTDAETGRECQIYQLYCYPSCNRL